MANRFLTGLEIATQQALPDLPGEGAASSKLTAFRVTADQPRRVISRRFSRAALITLSYNEDARTLRVSDDF